MKKQICKITCIGFLLSLTVITVQGQKSELSKKVYRTYAAFRDTRTEITNKYGMVHINTWNKDSVMFEVTMIVRAKDEYKTKKLMNEIDVSFVQSSHFIVAKTLFLNSSRNMVNDFTGSVIGQEKNIEINYIVFLPSGANLKVENKFGDIYCDDLAGNVTIDLSYGSLKAHDFNSTATISLSFGDAVINEIKNGILTANYGDFTIEKAGRLNINSKSSSFTLNDVNEVRLTSRRDKYNFGTVNTIDCDASFSTLNLTALGFKAFLRSSYGKFSVKSVENTATGIVISANYSNILLVFAVGGMAYDCDIVHTNTKLSYPVSQSSMKDEIIDAKTRKMRSAGVIGTSDKPAKVNITAVGGEISILQK